MVNPRQRRKVKNPNSKVRRRARVVKEVLTTDPILTTHWDRTNTLKRNYQKVGLISNPNYDLGKKVTNSKWDEWCWKKREKLQELQGTEDAEIRRFEIEEDIFEELEGIFNKGTKEPTLAVKELEEQANIISNRTNPIRSLSEYDRMYIGKLIERYHDDYQKMFMDLKLNPRQLTPNQLQKMAEKF